MPVDDRRRLKMSIEYGPYPWLATPHPYRTMMSEDINGVTAVSVLTVRIYRTTVTVPIPNFVAQVTVWVKKQRACKDTGSLAAVRCRTVWTWSEPELNLQVQVRSRSRFSTATWVQVRGSAWSKIWFGPGPNHVNLGLRDGQ